MRRPTATLALGLAWLCANGAIWDVVQVFAWSKMFAGYAETMSVQSALTETFNPTQPCELCVSVAEAREQAQNQLPLPGQHDAAKFVLVLHTVESPVFRNDPGRWLAPPGLSARDRTEPVPLPPPRV